MRCRCWFEELCYSFRRYGLSKPKILLHAKRAQIGGMLSPMELMELASTLRAGRILSRFFDEIAEQEIEVPLLAEYIDSLHPLIELQQEITYAISEHGER